MDTALLDILRRTSINNSDKPTHMTMYGPCQKWTIKDTEWESFWYGYCKSLNEKEPKKLCLAELPKRYMPVMIECTLKFHPLEGRGETYGYDFILHLAYCCQQVMLETLNISPRQTELICCILEGDEYVEDNYIVSKFKLHFPFCKTLASVQTNLRSGILKMLRTENVSSRLFQSPIESWEDIIDSNTAMNPTLMYGSSSKSEILPMRLERIVGKIDFDDISHDKVPEIELQDVFSTNHHEHVAQKLVDPEMFEQGDLDFWLPLFLSLNYYVPNVTPKSYENKLELSKSKSTSSNRMDSDKSNSDDQTEQDMAEKFLGMLDIHRCEKEIFWLDIGKALYSTFTGTRRGLELWIYFTQKSNKFTADDCEDYYNTFVSNRITVKTLAWYAKEDSPDEYIKWHKEWYGQAIEKAMTSLHNDVAEAIYRVYWLEFACSKLEKGCLYRFEAHIWKRLDNGQALRVMMTKDFVKILEGLRVKLSHDAYTSNDDNKSKDNIELHIKKLSSLINKLKTRTYKNNVFGELLEKFFVDDFESRLDSHDSLLGCFNGIIEASDKEAVLRPGKPEDYISKTTGLVYRPEYTWDTPLVKQVDEWMNQVFPEKTLCIYAGKLLGSCIRGRNSEKILAVLTGQGDNSKSMLKKGLEAVFGPYCITFPTAIFTTKRQGTGPIPELARAKAVRVGMIQEPDSDDSLRNGAIKEFTGGDRFFARMCNENGGEIDSMFKLFLMCNHVPIIPHCDQAIKNRLKIVPFLSTWKANAPESKEEQYKQRIFKIDPGFERKIPRLAPAFMWWLVQMYNLYCKEKLSEPEVIRLHTQTYWAENDIYMCFIEDHIEYARRQVKDWPKDKELPIDSSVKMPLNDLYARFKDWYSENHGQHKVPDRGIAKAEFSKRLKQQCLGNIFVGIQFKVENVLQI